MKTFINVVGIILLVVLGIALLLLGIWAVMSRHS
jgi:hypothetical protein